MSKYTGEFDAVEMLQMSTKLYQKVKVKAQVYSLVYLAWSAIGPTSHDYPLWQDLFVKS